MHLYDVKHVWRHRLLTMALSGALAVSMMAPVFAGSGNVMRGTTQVGPIDGPTVPKPTEDAIPVDADHFPDPAFREMIETYTPGNGHSKPELIDANQDGWLTKEEREAVTMIDFSEGWSLVYENGSYIHQDVDPDTKQWNHLLTDVSGLQYFPNIYWFELHENPVTSVDLSQNIKIREYYATYDSYALRIPDTGELDLYDLPGDFDPARASNFRGNGVVREGDIIKFTPGKNTLISYTYDTRSPSSNLRYLTFYLRATYGSKLPDFGSSNNVADGNYIIHQYFPDENGEYPSEPNSKIEGTQKVSEKLDVAVAGNVVSGFAVDITAPDFKDKVVVKEGETVELNVYYKPDTMGADGVSDGIPDDQQVFVTVGVNNDTYGEIVKSTVPSMIDLRSDGKILDTVTFGKLEAVVKSDDYRFLNWTFSGVNQEPIEQLMISDLTIPVQGGEHIQVTAMFTTKEISYVVQHYLQQLNGSYLETPALEETKVIKMFESTTVADNLQSFRDFAYDFVKSGYQVGDSLNVTDDNRTVIRLYYGMDSDNTGVPDDCEVQVVPGVSAGDTGYVEGNEIEQVVSPDGTISDSITIDHIVAKPKPGYIFDHWESNLLPNEFRNQVDLSGVVIPNVKPGDEIHIDAIFVPMDIKVINYAESCASWELEQGGWLEGDNLFRVKSDVACQVLVLSDGGHKVKLVNIDTYENSMATMTCAVQNHDQVVIFRVGDANLDGEISVADLVRINQYLNNEFEFDPVYHIAADGSMDDKISVADLVAINQYLNNQHEFSWRFSN